MDSSKNGSRADVTVLQSSTTVDPPRKRQVKPEKPYPEFPLYAHAAGVWAKRIRGRDHYFGPWKDSQAALERYLRERDFLFAGHPPPQDTAGFTLDEMVNRFIAAQHAKHDAGEITGRQLADYTRDGKRLLTCLGRSRPVDTLRTDDFAKLRAAMIESRNATTAANIITRQRSIFKWGHVAGLIATPINYGGAFAMPSARLRRRALRANGPKDLSATDIQSLLKVAESEPSLYAMILLGINAGLGNTDCSELCSKHLDMKGRLLDFRRPKTDAPRRAVLWPQTVKAIEEAMKARAETANVARELSDRVFLTDRGLPCVHMSRKGGHVDSVGVRFHRAAVECKVHRPGIGFYSLRHTFQTVADETRDFPAIDLVMGHVPDDGGGSAPFSVKMSARYRERISDDRLAAVADYVRAWLWPDKKTTKKRSKKTAGAGPGGHK